VFVVKACDAFTRAVRDGPCAEEAMACVAKLVLKASKQNAAPEKATDAVNLGAKPMEVPYERITLNCC
jgi:hypothetical protein